MNEGSHSTAKFENYVLDSTVNTWLHFVTKYSRQNEEKGYQPHTFQ